MNTQALQPIQSSAEGVVLSADYLNRLIARIEDLVNEAEKQRPIAGENMRVTETIDGTIISLVVDE